MDFETLLSKENKEVNKAVIRLTTSMWSDKKGLYFKKDVKFLRRKCEGYNILEEDSLSIGAEEIIPRIINLLDCVDGVYEVIVCNEYRDWESGVVEDYAYKLIPYEED